MSNTDTKYNGKYNGWTNYETWNAALWMGNDLDEYWREQAKEFYAEASADDTFTRKENASRALSERMKDEHEEALASLNMDNSFFADVLNAGVASVNWDEIAGSYIDDVEEKPSKVNAVRA